MKIIDLLPCLTALALFAGNLHAQGIGASEDEQKREALENQLRVMTVDALCLHYGMFIRREEMRIMPSYSKRDEILRKAFARLDVSPQNEGRISMRSLSLGMTECELIASRGFPQEINRTVNASGTTEQHVYGIAGPYVYTRNGRIIGWQDKR